MKQNAKIILFEPQCRGIEHLVFNSCIISAMHTIFKDSSISLYADKGHIDFIQKTNKIPIANVHLHIPHGYGRFRLLRILPFEFISLLRIQIHKPNILVCLSVTPFTVLFSKLLFNTVSVYYFFHGVLESLTISLHFWNTEYWLKYALSLRKHNTTNIVLGENIQQELQKIIPNIQTKVIDHPYFIQAHSLIIDNFPEILNIGSVGFGSVHKGTENLFELGQRIKTNVRFYHIGQIFNGKIIIPDDTTVEVHGGNRTLLPNEFNALIEQMHFCIFFYPRGSYKLTASGVIFDALTHLKPVIAIRNSYFEYLFAKMGNIGYLCDTVDEMAVIVKKIIKEKNITAYREQQKTIQDGLKYFSLEYLEKSLREIFKELLNGKDKTDN